MTKTVVPATIVFIATLCWACSPPAVDRSAIPTGQGWQCSLDAADSTQIGECHRTCDFVARSPDGSVRAGTCDAASTAWCITFHYANPTMEWSCHASIERCRVARDDRATGGPTDLSECGELP